MNVDMELYKTMYLIRRAEERIRELYSENEMKTPMHMSMGEESIVAAVCQSLNKDDQVFGTYRSHALYLAKTKDTDGFFAELYGKATGGSKGKAGSMHMSYPSKGFMGVSAVVGTTIPVAVGMAYANLYKGNDKRVAVFFGDGAVDEGVFWESLNFACLKKLKIVFVCEDNDLAIYTRKSQRRGYNNLLNIIGGNFHCLAYETTTVDVDLIYTLVQMAFSNVTESNGPIFINCSYQRYLEHVGVNMDTEVNYIDPEEWKRRDPLRIQREYLLNCAIPEERIRRKEQEIRDKIEKSIKKAKEAPFSPVTDIFSDVYA